MDSSLWNLLCTHKVCAICLLEFWLGVSCKNKNPTYFLNIKAFSACYILSKCSNTLMVVLYIHWWLCYIHLGLFCFFSPPIFLSNSSFFSYLFCSIFSLLAILAVKIQWIFNENSRVHVKIMWKRKSLYFHWDFTTWCNAMKTIWIFQNIQHPMKMLWKQH